MPGCGCLKKTSSALTSGRRNDNSCKADCLFRDEPADVVELTGGAEEHVFIGDELGVFIHEDLPDRAQVEVSRVIAEVFAMDAGPDEAAVGIRRPQCADFELSAFFIGCLMTVFSFSGVAFLASPR